MKKIITIMAALFAFSCTVSAQRYQMDVATNDGSIASYLMENVNDLICQDGLTIIRMNGESRKEYDSREIRSISWSEYNGSTGTGDTNTIQVTPNHNTFVTPGFEVKFYPGAITEPTTVTVSKVENPPAILECGVDGMVVYDFNLTGGQTQLSGIADIRLPMNMKPEDGDIVFGAFYNTETGQWETVDNHYDESTGEVVISTNHFSRYGAFWLKKPKGKKAYLELMNRDDLAACIAKPLVSYAELALRLKAWTYSDDPDAAALEAFTDTYSDVSQIGLDIGYNTIKSLGYEIPFLEKFSDVLGHVGTAVSVYQICRNDFKREDPQLAANTMKLCLTQILNRLTSACATNCLYASLAGVAIMDYSINKFGQYAWSGRKDMYQKGYRLYMEQEGGNLLGNEGWRWVDKIAPYFDTWKHLTNQEINKGIDNDVREFTTKPWRDPMFASYFHEATGATWSFTGGESQALEDELSGNLRAEIYRDYLPSCVERIKKELEVKAFDRMNEEMKAYAYQLNKGSILSFYDSSLKNGDDAKSVYAGYTVRYKEYTDVLGDKDLWQCELDDKGKGEISVRVGILALAEAKPVLELVSPDDKVVKVIELSNLKAGYARAECENKIDLSPAKTFVINVPRQGAVSFVEYDPGDYEYVGRLSPRSWLRSAACSDYQTPGRFKRQFYYTVLPNLTNEAREDTITLGFTHDSSVPFEEREQVNYIFKQEAGPADLNEMRSMLTGTWQNVSESDLYDQTSTFIFNADGTYSRECIRTSHTGRNYPSNREIGTYTVSEYGHNGECMEIVIKTDRDYWEFYDPADMPEASHGTGSITIQVFPHFIRYLQFFHEPK